MRQARGVDEPGAMTATDDRAPRRRLHADRDRALSFGGVAARYDRARPGYPPALIDALLAHGPARVLDVGCGTGKLGALLRERGCEVLGVEADERMAQVARQHGLQVEVAHFERWDPRGRRFDMVVSGQAWHWIDPAEGPRRAASALRGGGTLALVWNHMQHDPEVLAILGRIYERNAAELAGTSMSLGRVRADEFTGHVAALSASGLFGPVEAVTFEWRMTFTRRRWIEFLRTASDHILLDARRRRALLAELARVIDERLGGGLEVGFRTYLLSAERQT
jgi:SAM-dependent methyltransferase